MGYGSVYMDVGGRGALFTDAELLFVWTRVNDRNRFFTSFHLLRRQIFREGYLNDVHPNNG